MTLSMNSVNNGLLHSKRLKTRNLSLVSTKKFFKESDSHWFPMRIRNSSLSRLELMMERLNHEENVFETYVPLSFIKVKMDKMDFAPNMLNYIFVYSTYAKLKEVKKNKELFEPLRFVMHPVYDEKYNRHDEVLYISDKKMEDYKRVTAEENEKVIFLDNPAFACKPSQEVQITEGQFAGVMGRIKRIKGNRCVVIPIGWEIAVAITGIPRKHLRYLTDDEVKRVVEEEAVNDLEKEEIRRIARHKIY